MSQQQMLSLKYNINNFEQLKNSQRRSRRCRNTEFSNRSKQTINKQIICFKCQRAGHVAKFWRTINNRTITVQFITSTYLHTSTKPDQETEPPDDTSGTEMIRNLKGFSAFVQKTCPGEFCKAVVRYKIYWSEWFL